MVNRYYVQCEKKSGRGSWRMGWSSLSMFPRGGEEKSVCVSDESVYLRMLVLHLKRKMALSSEKKDDPLVQKQK